MGNEPTPFEVHEPGAYFHGTKADLATGDLLEPGRVSNYGQGRTAGHVYLTATLDAATWGRSWRWVRVVAGSTSWSPRAPSKTIPT